MADVMGFYEFLNFALRLLITISNIKRNVKLMNKIFEFDMKDSKHEKIEIELKDIRQNPNSKFVGNLKNSSQNLKEKNRIPQEGMDDISGTNAKHGKEKHLINSSYLTNTYKHPGDISCIEIEKSNRPFDEILSPIKKKPIGLSFSKHKETNDYCKFRQNLMKNNKIHFSDWDYLKFNFIIFCNKNRKLKHTYDLYKKAEEKLEDRFEVFYLLNKFDEVERLKSILLDKSQLAIFNFFTKEMVSENKDNNKYNQLIRILHYQNEIQKINEEIEKFRKKIKNFCELDKIDKKLFQNLPSEMKDFMKRKGN